MRSSPGRYSPSQRNQPRVLLATAITRCCHALLMTAVSLSCALVRPAVAFAAEESKRPVVVIATPEPTPITRRLQQEIEALGFNVVLEPRGFAESPDFELSSRNAVAAIVISTTSPGYIALFVLEPKTARIIKQELPIEAPKDPTAIELVATRAVELLRAARLEVTAEHRSSVPAVPKPPPTIPQPMPVEVAQPPRSTAQLLIGLGPGMLFMPHWQLGTTVNVTAAYVGTSQFGWMSSLSSSLTAASFRVTGVGRVNATATTFRLGSVVQSVRPAPLGLRLCAGVDGSQVKFKGETQSPYASHADYLSTFAPFLGVASNLRISSHLQLVAQVTGSWNLPRTNVRYGGKELRDWGQPSIHGVFTAEWQSL